MQVSTARLASDHSVDICLVFLEQTLCSYFWADPSMGVCADHSYYRGSQLPRTRIQCTVSFGDLTGLGRRNTVWSRNEQVIKITKPSKHFYPNSPPMCKTLINIPFES